MTMMAYALLGKLGGRRRQPSPVGLSVNSDYVATRGSRAMDEPAVSVEGLG
jgi:hypothetical protein